MTIFIPQNVDFIINTFYKNNYEAFMVGGCIRDALLNKEPKDYDIATSSKPEETIKLFKKTIPTGLQHGTVTVVINNESFEITTYRKDGDYKNNRHPNNVTFVSNIKDDLSRRDFTINAFAYNKKSGLIDFFNGKEDLKNKIIRSVGDPNIRFKEDALRMLRAIRFSAQLNFNIEDTTLKSIKQNNNLIKNISIERVRDELCKILISNNPKKGLLLLKDTGLLNYILPEIIPCIDFNQYNPYHNEDVFSHILSVVENTPNILILRLSALFHDIGKPYCFFLDDKNIGRFYKHNIKSEEITIQALKRLKFDNKSIDTITKLVKEHMNVLDSPSPSAIRRLIARIGLEDINLLFDLQEADIKSLALKDEVLNKFYNMKSMSKEIINSKAPFSIRDLKINGNILISKLNLNPGKNIGEILKYLLEITLENPNLNDEDILLEKASKYIKALE